jgi:RNA polymerase sigma-70 factor (ECF subfamily)
VEFNGCGSIVAERLDMESSGTPANAQDSRSDLELIDAINEGDPIAFEILYYRYRDWVVTLAYRSTGDRDLALDVLQETFLYFVKKFPGFRLTASLKTFLYPAVQHLSIAARRQAQRFQSTETELQQIETARSVSPVTAEHDLLQAVLASLSPEHREVVMLRFIDGFSLAEVATTLDIPLGTVKSRLHNALRSLREDERTKKFFEQ